MDGFDTFSLIGLHHKGCAGTSQASAWLRRCRQLQL